MGNRLTVAVLVPLVVFQLTGCMAKPKNVDLKNKVGDNMAVP